jgi:SAM-dependent methyltransferase
MSEAEHADVETASPEYARRFEGGVGRFFLDVQNEATLELLAPWPSARVLDVGGGHGQVTGALLRAGHEVTIYGSDETCRRGVSAFLGTGKARFESGNLLALPYKDRSFEIVLSYRLLPHVARWRELVAELCRVAASCVVVDYPTTRSANAAGRLLFPLKKGLEGTTRPFLIFHDRDIQEALEAGGFRVTGRRAEFLLPMALHRALGIAPLSRGFEAAARGLRLTSVLGSPIILRGQRIG